MLKVMKGKRHPYEMFKVFLFYADRWHLIKLRVHPKIPYDGVRKPRLSAYVLTDRRDIPVPHLHIHSTRFVLIISRSPENRSLMSWISSATIAILSRPRPHAITGTFTPSGIVTSGLNIPAPPSSIQPSLGCLT